MLNQVFRNSVARSESSVEYELGDDGGDELDVAKSNENRQYLDGLEKDTFGDTLNQLFHNEFDQTHTGKSSD
jgi:hypothetical protein